ncbi:effector-associated domain 2-containing protein [Actinomadura sp. 3N407]|uniref:effector-associated domain 2-containing protein n=1 Tax=Actinomadura sp. 3N407 TaxID=3457423 RepID=UPI003FCCAAA4
MDTARGDWHPAGLCSLYLCDIASFGDPSRTDRVRVHVRGVLYESLGTAFRENGIAFDACYWEDRGDGVMIAVPPEYDLTTLLTTVTDRLRAEIRHHNAVSGDPAKMQLRVAVHMGMARSDGRGLVGTAVNDAFRILDAPALKEALRVSGTAVGVIVSDRVYDDVVRHGWDLLDPGDYRRVEVRVKELTTISWMNVPGLPSPVPAQSPAPAPAGTVRPAGDPPPLFELVDHLLDIPLLAHERGRDQLVDALPFEIGVVIPRRPDARSDTYAIVRTCLDYPGGLHRLHQAVKAFTGPSMAMARVERTLNRFLLGP